MSVVARSLLYVPGDRPDRVAKALASAADAVIVDLEDSVGADRKASAREVVGGLGALPGRPGVQRWVRIGAGVDGRLDLATAAGAAIDGVVLAKCESVAWIDEVAAGAPDVQLALLVESAVGLRDVHHLAAHPRVRRLHLGEVDLVADLGGRPPADHLLVQHARIEVVIASAAAGLDPPVGGVHVAIDDLDALAVSSDVLRQLGFGGRAIVHPTHIAGTNAAFSPSAAELAWADDVLARAAADPHGAQRAADGSMIDEAVLRRARHLRP